MGRGEMGRHLNKHSSYRVETLGSRLSWCAKVDTLPSRTNHHSLTHSARVNGLAVLYGTIILYKAVGTGVPRKGVARGVSTPSTSQKYIRYFTHIHASHRLTL